MPEMKVNPSDAAHQGRYSNMAFPKYTFQEYPKRLKIAGKVIRVNSHAEEFDAKLKHAENPAAGAKLTQDEILAVKREAAHNDELRGMFEKNMKMETEMNELKKQLAESKQIRVDPGDHEDGKKAMAVDGGDNKTEVPVASLGSGLVTPPKDSTTSAQAEAQLTSPTGKANDGATETKGTGPSISRPGIAPPAPTTKP